MMGVRLDVCQGLMASLPTSGGPFAAAPPPVGHSTDRVDQGVITSHVGTGQVP